MRIQTQLFLGTACLILTLMAVQWWLHTRQLRQMDQELAELATDLGQSLLFGPKSGGGMAPEKGQSFRSGTGEARINLQVDAHAVVFDSEGESDAQIQNAGVERQIPKGFRQSSWFWTQELDQRDNVEVGNKKAVMVGPPEAGSTEKSFTSLVLVDDSGKSFVWRGKSGQHSHEASREAKLSGGASGQRVRVLEDLVVLERSLEEGENREALWLGKDAPFGEQEEDFFRVVQGMESEDGSQVLSRRVLEFEFDTERDLEITALSPVLQEVSAVAAETGLSREVHRVELRVEKEGEGSSRVLIIEGAPGGARRVPLHLSDSIDVARKTLHQTLLASGFLLFLGLALSALLANRVSRPLRELAQGAERLGAGELETRVQTGARGEVGELEKAFNSMAQQLSRLEEERQRWRAREHLAQLGGLARGLAHTLRNPLNTLGLVVEELASGAGDAGSELAQVARGQIRRVDRWLRSFLALGAGPASEAREVDLRELLEDLCLEVLQETAPLKLDVPEEPCLAQIVPAALRAALSNLLSNALEASPQGRAVSVELSQTEGWARISICDEGPGLPDIVRQRLFSPHVTTKAGGSGMGLFLSRQLIEGGHEGRLELNSQAGRGTEALVFLPLS